MYLSKVGFVSQLKAVKIYFWFRQISSITLKNIFPCTSTAMEEISGGGEGASDTRRRAAAESATAAKEGSTDTRKQQQDDQSPSQIVFKSGRI